MSLSRTLKRHRGWIALAAVLVIGGAALLITRQSKPESAGPTYTTEAAAIGTLSVTVDGTGYLAVRDEVDVYPDADGEVSDVNVAEGDTVSAGDVLYELDDTSVRKAIAKAKASRTQASQSLQRAKLELYQAKASLARLEDGADAPSSTVEPSDITVARTQVTIATTGVSSATGNYNSAADDYSAAVDSLDDLKVTAPCDGVVWSVNVVEGDTVGTSGGSSGGSGGSSAASSASSSSSAPMTIARDGLMGVELSVNEVDVTTLKPGQDAEVLFDAVSDLTMTGTVDEVAKSGTIESGVVSYGVWLTLDGTEKRLKTGMSASATIVTHVERNALLVSNSAVKTATDGTSYVEVLDEGATPQRVTVVTGAASATQTVIKSGIDSGAKVVTKTVAAGASTSSSTSSSGDQGGRSGGGVFMLGGGPGPGGD